MYDPGPSDEELEAIGIRREDVADHSDVDVWPENWKAFLVFSAAATQWRVGTCVVGLDYVAIKWLMELHGIKRKQQVETLRAIRTMESIALGFMNKR